MPVEVEKVIKLAGDIPFENIENWKYILENFCTNYMVVLVTNKTTGITKGTHCHNSYEFNIVHTRMPFCIIDKKVYDMPKNTFFAINPMQKHGLLNDLKDFNLCGLHIDKNLLEDVAYSIYGSRDIVFSNNSIPLGHDLNMLVALFLEELRYKQSGHEFILENLGLLIIAMLLRQGKHNLIVKPFSFPKDSSKSIIKVIDYMNENFSTGISCTEMSRIISMDKYSFIRAFKAYTGSTPYDYLLDLKIEKAKKMLKTEKYTVTEVSMMCGFSSHSHFTSTFKKKTGISPTEYKLNI